jgi:hypothetical protein
MAEADPQVCTIRANEQPWSSQPGKTGTAKADENDESAGQGGCAARDLNPEPAD